jgi:hypothetical protein
MLEQAFQLRHALNSNTLIHLRSQMAPLAQGHMSHEGGRPHCHNQVLEALVNAAIESVNNAGPANCEKAGK